MDDSYEELLKKVVSHKGGLLFDLIEDDPFTENFNISSSPRSKDKIHIVVYANEGPVPHFHIINKGVDDICVRIDVAEYFLHGSHLTMLTSDQRKVLDNFMKMKAKDTKQKLMTNSTITVWEVCRNFWDNNCINPNREIVGNNTMKPNYRLLPVEKR